MKARTMFNYNYKDIPHRYPKGIKPLLNVLNDWLEERELVGDAFFCSPGVWKARGEEYCLSAEAIIVFDSSPMYEMMNGEFGWQLREQFDNLLRSKGYYMESGTSWYGGLYKE
jgi:hypothetical protein